MQAFNSEAIIQSVNLEIKAKGVTVGINLCITRERERQTERVFVHYTVNNKVIGAVKLVCLASGSAPGIFPSFQHPQAQCAIQPV